MLLATYYKELTTKMFGSTGHSRNLFFNLDIKTAGRWLCV